MSFEAFSNDDIQKILDHSLKHMSEEALAEQVEKHGGMDKYREYLSAGFENEQTVAEIIKWYGSKEKAIEAVLQSTDTEEELTEQQDKNAEVYKQFVSAKEADNADLAKEAVAGLAECYKEMFKLDNAINILLDLAKEYLQCEKLTEVTNIQYGEGVAEFIGNAINEYYGA